MKLHEVNGRSPKLLTIYIIFVIVFPEMKNSSITTPTRNNFHLIGKSSLWSELADYCTTSTKNLKKI